MEAMVVSDTEDSMERDLLMLKLNQKLLLMLMLVTLEAIVDTVMVATMEDTEDTMAMVVSDTEDFMERDLLMLKPNQKLLLMLDLDTSEEDTEAMGDTDMV